MFQISKYVKMFSHKAEQHIYILYNITIRIVIFLIQNINNLKKKHSFIILIIVEQSDIINIITIVIVIIILLLLFSNLKYSANDGMINIV